MRKKLIAVILICLIWASPSVCFGQTEGGGVRVAFLDSGISLKHIKAESVDVGENFVFPERDTEDRVGHGTATAGILLGSSNMGIVGVCPSAIAVPLVLYDAYPTGVAAASDAETMADAIRAAVDKFNCRIINISMGTTIDSLKLREATEYALEKGAIIVSAVGNANESAPERVYYPAAYEGVIGVGAADGEITASFSQRNSVDVLAEAVNIKAVTNRNSEEAEIRSGTSYACAYVSALCAKVISERPNLTAKQVVNSVIGTARDIEKPGYDKDSGWGIADEMYVLSRDTSDFYFCDIVGHTNEESIIFCAENNVFKTEKTRVFLPDDTIKRGEFIAALYRAAGKPKTDGGTFFSDTGNDERLKNALSWAYEAKITKGIGHDTFGANECLKFEDAMLMLYRYAENNGDELKLKIDILKYDDSEEISQYAKDAYSYLLGSGVIAAKEGRLTPKKYMTKADAAVIIEAFIVKLKK